MSVININCEVFEVVDGKKINALKPNAEGLYVGIPLAVIDLCSRNNTIYDGKTFAAQLTDANSPFKIALNSGGLFGELDHPSVPHGTPNRAFLERILQVKQDRTSHFFNNVYLAEVLPNGGRMVRGDLKPFGMYKDILEDSLMDPHINTAFSLRSITRDTMIDKIKQVLMRYVQRLVTFDFVTVGGFEEASKRWAGAVESVTMKLEDVFAATTFSAAMEEIKDKNILELFGAKTMMWKSTSIGIHLPDTNSVIDDDGRLRSVFHSIVKR